MLTLYCKSNVIVASLQLSLGCTKDCAEIQYFFGRNTGNSTFFFFFLPSFLSSFIFVLVFDSITVQIRGCINTKWEKKKQKTTETTGIV